MGPDRNRPRTHPTLLISLNVPDNRELCPLPTHHTNTAMSAADADQEMGNEQETTIPPPPPQPEYPPQPSERASMPSTRFTIRVPGQMNYAGALKRSAEQAEEADEENRDEPLDGTEGATEPASPKPNLRTSGLIKGLDNNVFANLDLQVREAWESQAQEAVFVHYLDGGYSPNIAQNVHVIAEDLKGESNSVNPHDKANQKTSAL